MFSNSLHEYLGFILIFLDLTLDSVHGISVYHGHEVMFTHFFLDEEAEAYWNQMRHHVVSGLCVNGRSNDLVLSPT